MSKISIIMPAYNAGRWIAQSISSVLAQTYGDFELIVINDGSLDNTADIIRQFDDPRIQCIYQQNKGLPAARNTGLQAAKGVYVGFLDADDLWQPTMLETCLDFLETHPEVDIVRTTYLWIDTHGTHLPALPYCPACEEDPFACILLNAIGVMQTTLLKQEIFAHIGLFDEELRTAEDWDLLLRIAADGFTFGFIEQPLLLYRIHSGNKTSVYNEHLRADELLPIENIFGNPSILSQYGHLKAQALAQKLAKLCVYAFAHELTLMALEDYTLAITNDQNTLFDVSLYYRIACADIPIGQPPSVNNIDLIKGQRHLHSLSEHIVQMEKISAKARRKALKSLHLALGMVFYGICEDMASARKEFLTSLCYCPCSTNWLWLIRSILGKNMVARLKMIHSG